MPNISLYLLRQFGIAVFMYYRDTAEHGAPHLHVRYQEHWAALRLPDGERLAGSLPSKVEHRVSAWIAMHEEALMERWALAVEGRPIERID